MIETLVPDPAWQDEQMAAYVAARSSNDEAGQRQILARVVEAFGPYLDFVSRSFAARLRSIESLEAEDLISVSKIALIDAMNRWDPKYGKELSHLAAKYIRGYCLQAIGRLSYGSVSVPGHFQRIVRKYRRLAEDNQSEEGEQLLQEKHLSQGSKSNVRRMARQGIPRVCLDAPVGHESTQTAEEVIEDPASGRPLEIADIREALSALMERLTLQEQLVLYLGCPSYVELPQGFEVRNRRGDRAIIPAPEEIAGGLRYSQMAKYLKIDRVRANQIGHQILENCRGLEVPRPTKLHDWGRKLIPEFSS